jgi:hypothetical protein
MTDGATLRRWRDGGCTCPVPRDKLHHIDCPYWQGVLAEVARVSDEHRPPERAYEPVEGRTGKRVVVKDEYGHVLFHGTLAETAAPWALWTRVIPDSVPVDLGPRYKVEEA